MMLDFPSNELIYIFVSNINGAVVDFISYKYLCN